MSNLSTFFPSGGGTPLADSIPQQFQVNSAGNLLLYSGATPYDDSGATFWSYFDLQGAYITSTSPTAYTEIVSVTGSGMLGTIVTGALLTDDDIFIEVTIDDEVREWRIFADAFWRGILTFSLYNGWSKSGGMLAGSPASFDPTYTTVYSARDTTNATTDIGYISPAILSQGIRFKSNMKVRIKSATSFAATNLRDRHGVLYVID
jgi:hypothetical protein